jgi:hypothetical protein
MATMKAIRTSIGKSIRKATGLKLPVAMSLAKKLDRNRSSLLSKEAIEKIRPYLSVRMDPPIYIGDGIEYDAEVTVVIRGPKGTYDYGWSAVICEL